MPRITSFSSRSFTGIGFRFGPKIYPLGTPMDGGYYMGDFTTSSEEYRLIIAPDINTGDSGDTNEGWTFGKPISTSTNGIPGTESTFDGLANTNSWINFAGRGSLVDWIETRTINGFTDWYIPSRGEFNQIVENENDLIGVNFDQFENNFYGQDRSYFTSNSKGRTNPPSSFITYGMVFQNIGTGDVTETGNAAFTGASTRAVRRVPTSQPPTATTNIVRNGNFSDNNTLGWSSSFLPVEDTVIQLTTAVNQDIENIKPGEYVFKVDFVGTTNNSGQFSISDITDLDDPNNSLSFVDFFNFSDETPGTTIVKQFTLSGPGARIRFSSFSGTLEFTNVFLSPIP